MININIDHNQELFEKCDILKQYSIFIHRVREYNIYMNNLDAAVAKSVDECIQEGILKDLLEKQKKEGFNVVLTEFDEEKYKKIIREEGSIETLCTLVAKRKLTLKVALEECNLTKEEFLEEMNELGLELPN